MRKGFPGKFKSSNVSRDNVSREIGRTGDGKPHGRPEDRTSARTLHSAPEAPDFNIDSSKSTS